MSRIGDQDFRPLEIAPGLMVGSHDQHPGELALGTGRWLKSHSGKTANFLEHFL